MEGFIKASPLDIGPIYFFDQLKPETKKWKKETCDHHFSHLIAKYSDKKKKSKGPKKARANSVTLSDKGDESFSLSTSEPSVRKLLPNLKLSKRYWLKILFAEYKHIAPGVLYELEKTLHKYARYNINFPVGIVNLMSYSWQELTEDVYGHASKSTKLEQDKALQGDTSNVTIVNLKKYPSRSNSKEELHSEHRLVKAKSDHLVVPSKSMEKMSLISQNHCIQNSHEKNLPVVIHFSLSSKICLENGWIFHPYAKLEILKWKTVLGPAVKRLQVAINQIKTEGAKLKKEGFNKQLILSHYNDPDDENKIKNSLKNAQSFWLDLLKRKPQMPTIRKNDPGMRKFHYALLDGSTVCQSYSDLPWGGVYTNIFSDLPNTVILGTFTPFGCGSISFPQRKMIAMMFNQDGGFVLSKKGNIIREWMWPSSGKLVNPVEIEVNKYITVKIAGRFAITLHYRWERQNLKLSLAPLKCKPPYLPDALFPAINPISGEARLFNAYKRKPLGIIAQNKEPSSSGDPVDADTFDPGVYISPMHDLVASVKLRRLQRKAKHILLHWLNHYRFILGLESLHICKIPRIPQKVVIKQNVSSATALLKQDAKEKDEYKEYLRYRNTFLTLKGVFMPSPPHYLQRIPVISQSSRLPLPIESNDSWFGSQLVCPVVLRRTLCGKEGDTCRCSSHSIPEVTDLEYDHLISNQLSSVDQIIVVYVFSTKEEDKNIKEVAKVYRERNRSRSMPCIQSRLDPFRLLKYNIMSASKFTGSNCPLLVQRHNIIPGIFLMYIRGKLLFANFIFNGYSTSAKDLQKQIVKTWNDYYMGYFLPSDFRIRA